MGFWSDLGATLLGGAATALSPLTGGISGAFGGPLLGQGLSGLFGDDPAPAQKGLMTAQKRAPVQQGASYTDAIRRLSEQ